MATSSILHSDNHSNQLHKKQYFEQPACPGQNFMHDFFERFVRIPKINFVCLGSVACAVLNAMVNFRWL